MISLSKPQRTALGAVALVALLAGCTNPSPVSPAVVTQAPAPARPPMPTDAELGTPSATFTALPDTAIAGQQSGTSGTGTLFFQGKRYRFTAGGMTATGFGNNASPITGNVYNLTKISDFAGTYTLTAMNDAHTQAVLKNEKGVSIRAASLQSMSGGLEAVVIRITR